MLIYLITNTFSAIYCKLLLYTIRIKGCTTFYFQVFFCKISLIKEPTQSLILLLMKFSIIVMKIVIFANYPSCQIYRGYLFVLSGYGIYLNEK